jgi:hypothetical protein
MCMNRAVALSRKYDLTDPIRASTPFCGFRRPAAITNRMLKSKGTGFAGIGATVERYSRGHKLPGGPCQAVLAFWLAQHATLQALCHLDERP